jgi:hypothetical protein
MDPLEDLLNRVIDWRAVAVQQAEDVVQRTYEREVPPDPATAIARARRMLLEIDEYR